MGRVKFIIQDWACNTLQHTGKFNYGNYGRAIGVPMVFDSFDDGWEWIYENISDDDSSYDDVFVEVRP